LSQWAIGRISEFRGSVFAANLDGEPNIRTTRSQQKGAGPYPEPALKK
jgi:hypothetical protein